MKMNDPPTPAESDAGGPGELRRSQSKLDFSVARERSFIRQHQQSRDSTKGKHRHSTMAVVKGKPTLEIYRPPKIRADGSQNGSSANNPTKLNVNAKEFTMKTPVLQMSRSSSSLSHSAVMSHSQSKASSSGLQSSKSAANMLHTLRSPQVTAPSISMSSSSFASSSSSNTSSPVSQGLRVHFRLDTNQNEPVRNAHFSENGLVVAVSENPYGPVLKSRSTMFGSLSSSSSSSIKPLGSNLQRSRSFTASMSSDASRNEYAPAIEAPDLGQFPPEVQKYIQACVSDPNTLPARVLMDLVRHIIERAVVSVSYALPAVRLCMGIIEKEREETFLESVLNTSLQWFQERERLLKPQSRFIAFIHYINEMYSELKRRTLMLKTKHNGDPPGTVLLNLLYKCCLECLKPPVSQGYADALFFVLTAIGRDLEQEQHQLQTLISSIRDAFLSPTTGNAARKTLLQLIELHAAHWQLPAAAVMYYTTTR